MELLDFLRNQQRLTLEPDDLASLRRHLRGLFEAGPGAKEEIDEDDANTENEEDEENVFEE